MRVLNIHHWFLILLLLLLTGSSWSTSSLHGSEASPLIDEGQMSAAALDHHNYLPIIQYADPAAGNLFYLSPTGNDSHAGNSEATAWATFDRAWQSLYPGDTLVLLDGVYYQSLRPNRRNGEPGKPITIRTMNDGQAIIDGEFVRTPIALLSYLPSDYYVIEGIVARNGSIPPLAQAVIRIEGSHNVLKRVSAYDAHTDYNTTVISLAPSASYNLIEDCVAAGTGRKMINIYKGTHNTVRRCFAYWQEWDGRESCQAWPNGQNIQVYHGDYNIIENSIAYGPIPQWSISVQANSPNASAVGNQILGSITLNAGRNPDGTIKEWGDTRPQPTSCTGLDDPNWPNRRSGFSLRGPGELRDNVFQDIFSWGNVGLGIVSGSGTFINNQIIRATALNNGINNPCGPWPCLYGGVETDALQSDFDVFSTIQNSRLENIFVSWPNYPSGVRNLTSMNDEGARLTHRYIDGVLTNEPLWPWPMEGRIQAELGISVTNSVTNIIFGGTNQATEVLGNGFERPGR